MSMDTVGELAPEEQKVEAPPGEKGKLSLLESAKQARRWTTELNASKKWMEKFHTGARKCEKVYFGEATGGDYNYSGKTNLFWSNVQVVMSAIYGRLPKASVKRKFDDYDDDVARVAGEMMQRILNGDIEREWDDTNAALRDATADRFVVGLGQVWCRYEAEFESHSQAIVDPATGMPVLDSKGNPEMQEIEEIVFEEAEVDYVYWDDFRYSPCRRWRECRWVARRVYMPEEKLKARFNLTDDQMHSVPMTTRMPNGTDSSPDNDVLRATPFKQAAVWEIWSRDDNYACWFVEGMGFLLDCQPDPLELDDFFPCPQPIVASTLTKAFLPRSDYAMVQDLYTELDKVNARICALTDAVRATGVYDKTAAAVKNMLTGKGENQLIPIDNWSHFVEKGGMKGSVDWLPIEQFVNAIVQLNQRKTQLQHDLYEVLGISDIMRGASVASETATAQTLKVQYGGARLSNMQNEVARFVSEVMRIRANIIANVFQPQTILQRSQIERTPDAELAQPAMEMLKNFGTSMYSIKVTADSLAAPDWAQEKEARTEFLGAASNYLMAVGPMVEKSPSTGGFLVKLLQWAAAGFKGAGSIEGVLDQAAKQLEQAAAAPPPPPPPPSPEDQKNLASAAKSGAEADKTKKEAALIPPIELPPQPMPPGQGMPPVGAGPGTVAPMAPQMPQPFNPMQ